MVGFDGKVEMVGFGREVEMAEFSGEVQMVGVGGNLLDECFLCLVDEDDRRLEEPTHLEGSDMVWYGINSALPRSNFSPYNV